MGISIRKLARELNVSDKTVRDWIADDRWPFGSRENWPWSIVADAREWRRRTLAPDPGEAGRISKPVVALQARRLELPEPGVLWNAYTVQTSPVAAWLSPSLRLAIAEKHWAALAEKFNLVLIIVLADAIGAKPKKFAAMPDSAYRAAWQCCGDAEWAKLARGWNQVMIDVLDSAFGREAWQALQEGGADAR